jgi:uncharacterized beta-barrel protein YwiB (DUF1934 family)
MMTPNVKVKVTGIQQLMENSATGQERTLAEEDITETCVEGYCPKKGGKYFLLYDEVSEDGTQVHTTVKLEEDGFQVSRRGQVVSQMTFAPGKWDESPYSTPFGTIYIGLQVGNVSIRRWHAAGQEDTPCILAEADYQMEMDHIPTAMCKVRIEVTPLVFCKG